MQQYLPTPHELSGFAGLAATLVLFLALGGATTARRTLPEIQLAAGWGVACLVLTLWGVLTPWSLRWPAAALLAVGLAWLARPGWSDRIAGWRAFGPILALTVPLWLVMLSIWPSQIDTWLNLLPNAAYLTDHDRFPMAGMAPHYSFLPVAPYNTQFAAYLASLASGAFADGTMGLFNIALLSAAALLLARVLAGTETGRPPWWACAVGLLMVAPLNAGYVPRFFMSPYGEASLAVTTLFAVWLAAETLTDLARGIAWPRALAPLALVLAALINAKQSGIGLLVPIGASMFVLGWVDPAIRLRRTIVAVVLAVGPAVVLYLLWRLFTRESGFPAGELKALAFADWNIGLLPQIIWAIMVAIFHKATFYLCVTALLVLTVLWLRRDPWSREGRLLALTAGVFILFNGFLVFTYVAHFPPSWALRAHSHFRYNSQISLLVLLGLIVTLRPYAATWFTAHPHWIRSGARLAVALILLVPIAGAPMLRFDRDTPQTELRQLAQDVAAYVEPGDRLALLLPRDIDDSVGSFMRGTLLFTPPRRPGIDFRVETTVTPATLAAAGAAGYRLALITCTPPGFDGLTPGEAVLLRMTPTGWQTVRSWVWPASINSRGFAGMLARGPACSTRPSA